MPLLWIDYHCTRQPTSFSWNIIYISSLHLSPKYDNHGKFQCKPIVKCLLLHLMIMGFAN